MRRLPHVGCQILVRSVFGFGLSTGMIVPNLVWRDLIDFWVNLKLSFLSVNVTAFVIHIMKL